MSARPIAVVIASSGQRWQRAYVEWFDSHTPDHELLLRDDFATTSHDLDAIEFDVLIIGAGHSLLTASVAARLGQQNRIVIGVVDHNDPDSHDQLAAVGVEHIVDARTEPNHVAELILQIVNRRVEFTSVVEGAAGGQAAHNPEPSRPAGTLAVVTGATAGVGATEVAIGLSAAGHRRHRETLLVDADVFDPHIAQRLGVGVASPTLVDTVDAVLHGNGQLRETLHPKSGVGRVVAGLENPDHYRRLIPEDVAAVLGALRRRWRQIIVRVGAPLYADTDERTELARQLISLADRVVVGASATPAGAKSVFRWAEHALELTDEPRVHVAANGVLRRNSFDQWHAEVQRTMGRCGVHALPFDPRVVYAAGDQRAVAAGRWTKAAVQLHKQVIPAGSQHLERWLPSDLRPEVSL